MHGKAIEIPEAGAEWHPAIKRFYESLKTSGQSQFYEDSDWATAFYLCEREDMNVRSGKPSAQMTGIFFTFVASLGVTEGDRRRMRIELSREEQEEAPSVGIMRDYRAGLNLPTGVKSPLGKPTMN